MKRIKSTTRKRLLGGNPLAVFLFMAIVGVVGGGTVGCDTQAPEPYIKDPNIEPSQVSYNLNSTESKDGNRSHRIRTPLMEHYGLATEPFTEFTKGLTVETYDDSTRRVKGDLRADYAKYNERLKLWEVRGNVVANNYDGNRRLYTEQLWWDERGDRIYSDRQVRVMEGKSTHVGIGFQADGGFNKWSFRSPRGQMEVQQRDTTSNGSAGLAATK